MSPDPNCPDCKGKGTIELFTSVVPCKCKAPPKFELESVSISSLGVDLPVIRQSNRPGLKTIGSISRANPVDLDGSYWCDHCKLSTLIPVGAIEECGTCHRSASIVGLVKQARLRMLRDLTA